MKYIGIIGKWIIFAGIIIILGTAGASDIEEINFMEALANVLLGFSFIAFGRMLKEVAKLNIRKRRSTGAKRICIFERSEKIGYECRKAS